MKNPHAKAGSMVMLQECSSEATASVLVYAPLAMSSLDTVLRRGGNPDFVQILPSGFTILPSEENGVTKGSLVSVAFQILGDSNSSLHLTLDSVDTVRDLVMKTIRNIRIALRAGH